jgi:hypothetical protein
VAIQVVQVLDESVWTWEIVGERLGQCVGFVIRWRRANVRSVLGGTSSIAESGAGQNFSFPSPRRSDFEFEDEDTGNEDSSDPSHREEGTSATRSMSPLTEASQCTAGVVPVPVPDGLPIGGQSRRYSMRNRHTRATPVWEMGVRIQDRVKLNSVLEAKREAAAYGIVSGRWAKGTFWTSGTWLGHRSMRFERRGLCRC